MPDFVRNSKAIYYLVNFLGTKIPKKHFQSLLSSFENELKKPENSFLKDRIDYYISCKEYDNLSDSIQIGNFERPKKGTTYFFDLINIAKYFPSKLKIKFKPGDITQIFEEPTIVKSRPINHNGNSVLLKLNKIRHYKMITDKVKFDDKIEKIVWRGKIHTRENRKTLLDTCFNQELCDVGASDTPADLKHFEKPFLSIKEQLKYKYILSIEGNDVATNLKWIMNSNSLCFMPKPQYETWFMEGRLTPNKHYVLIKEDFSDIKEKIEYYNHHPEKAKEIISNANKWVNQFKNRKQEKLIAIGVLSKYFSKTNQVY